MALTDGVSVLRRLSEGPRGAPLPHRRLARV